MVDNSQFETSAYYRSRAKEEKKAATDYVSKLLALIIIMTPVIFVIMGVVTNTAIKWAIGAVLLIITIILAIVFMYNYKNSKRMEAVYLQKEQAALAAGK